MFNPFLHAKIRLRINEFFSLKGILGSLGVGLGNIYIYRAYVNFINQQITIPSLNFIILFIITLKTSMQEYILLAYCSVTLPKLTSRKVGVDQRGFWSICLFF